MIHHTLTLKEKKKKGKKIVLKKKIEISYTNLIISILK